MNGFNRTAAVVAICLGQGCGGNSTTSQSAGSERGHCLEHSTCTNRLICLSDFCVRPNATDGGGSDGTTTVESIVISAASRTPDGGAIVANFTFKNVSFY
jgi:hypothetical protein